MVGAYFAFDLWGMLSGTPGVGHLAHVAGFVAAVFGGSHLQVSGPTGAMTVVLLPIVVIDRWPWTVVVILLIGSGLQISQDVLGQSVSPMQGIVIAGWVGSACSVVQAASARLATTARANFPRMCRRYPRIR